MKPLDRAHLAYCVGWGALALAWALVMLYVVAPIALCR